MTLILFWSGRRGSNSRPQPWQGCALPTELLPRVFPLTDCKGTHFFFTSKLFRKNFQKKCKNLHFSVFLLELTRRNAFIILKCGAEITLTCKARHVGNFRQSQRSGFNK